MKTTKPNIFTFAFLLFTFSLSFAQEKPVQNKVEKPNSTQAVGDKIEFKNGTTNSILTITDEGNNAGSILIPQGPTLTNPNDDNKLYNIGGTLHWNGFAVGTAGSAGGWTDAGSIIYNTTLTDKVGIGTDNPNSKLSVGGLGNEFAAISGEATNGYGIYGKATTGRGVFGETSATGNVTNYGGMFIANGDNGRGVLGVAPATGNVDNYGGKFHAHGDQGYGVYGEATATGDVTNYGGRFISSGNQGIGVYGEATATGNVTNYGGRFEANGDQGRGVYGKALGSNAYAGYFLGRGYFSENVGIGTENPSSKLSVGGSGLSSASISAITSLATGIGVYAEASASSAYAGYFDGRGYFTGNVGIGQTSAAFKLHVKDDQSNNFVARIENTSIGSNADGLAILINADIPGSGNHFIRFQKSGGAGIGSISGNGSSVSYNTTSDARLKMNIKEYSNALNVLSNIGIKKYERIANPGIKEIGVIAQELQKVYPQAVSGTPDSDVKTDPMMVDYSKLTPLLVKAVQEQQEIIKTQESTIKELENRLSKIESLLDGKRFTSVSK